MDKGSLEVDWIVSLGIFLVFVSMFFVLVRPFSAEKPDASEALIANLEKNLVKNTTWHVQRVPVIIRSNISGNEPIIADFQFNWKNMSFSDNTTFFSAENKLVFVQSLRKGTIAKWVVSSPEPYPQQAFTGDLSATTTSASISGARFGAFFDGILKDAAHFDRQRITNFNLSLNGVPVKAESASKETNLTNLVAEYKLSNTEFNHTTFVVAGYPRLYGYVALNEKLEPKNLTIQATLHNYTNYFIDNSLSGQIEGNEEKCVSKFGRYADFYDGLSGVSFITDDSASIEFCTHNTSVSVSIIMALRNGTRYDIIFHEGDYNSSLKYVDAYTATTGLVENLTGLSIELIRQVNGSDYSNLKSAWGFPTGRDFSFELLNGTLAPIYNYTGTSPGRVNVFTKEFDEPLMDKYGNKAKHRLRVKAW